MIHDTVLNKATLELFIVNKLDNYDTGTWIINPDLSSVDGVDKKYWKLVDDQVSEMSQAEKDEVDSAHLEECRQLRMNQVDERSAEIIGAGFIFDGHMFSLSQNAQLNWNSLKTLINSGDIGPEDPITVSTMNPENDTYTIQPSGRFMFFGLAFTTVKAILDSGRAIRTAMKQAETLEDLLAIEDPR